MSSSKKQRPIFQMIAGISLNGKISDERGNFDRYSSEEDKYFLQKKIKESDALIMGRKTFEKHTKKQKKPLIIFSRNIKGVKIDKERSVMTHWFNDSKEELENLCFISKYRNITILGGAEIYHWCIKNRLLTDIYLTIEPFLIDKGKHLIEGMFIKNNERWKIVSLERINTAGTILIHYKI